MNMSLSSLKFNSEQGVQVAVGVIHDKEGRILFTQRPNNKPYSGWWEFPGGKLESNESIESALYRELKEELGIEIEIAACYIWLYQTYHYEHAKVILHTANVFNFTGKITALENQAFQWGYANSPPQPFLPSGIPVLKAMQLPNILYKTNKTWLNLNHSCAFTTLHWSHQDLLQAYTVKYIRKKEILWLSSEVNTIKDIHTAHQLGCDFVIINLSGDWDRLKQPLINVPVPVFIDINYLNHSVGKHLITDLKQVLNLANTFGALGIVINQ